MLLVRQIEEHESANREEAAQAMRDQLDHLIESSAAPTPAYEQSAASADESSTNPDQSPDEQAKD